MASFGPSGAQQLVAEFQAEELAHRLLESRDAISPASIGGFCERGDLVVRLGEIGRHHGEAGQAGG